MHHAIQCRTRAKRLCGYSKAELSLWICVISAYPVLGHKGSAQGGSPGPWGAVWAAMPETCMIPPHIWLLANQRFLSDSWSHQPDLAVARKDHDHDACMYSI